MAVIYLEQLQGANFWSVVRVLGVKQYEDIGLNLILGEYTRAVEAPMPLAQKLERLQSLFQAMSKMGHTLIQRKPSC